MRFDSRLVEKVRLSSECKEAAGGETYPSDSVIGRVEGVGVLRAGGLGDDGGSAVANTLGAKGDVLSCYMPSTL